MAIQSAVLDPSATRLFDLISSQRITVVIYVAARLGVADHLAEGPVTAAELARRTGADERSLRRLLRALVTIGICQQVGSEQFGLTPVGAHLAGSAKQSLKAYALFEGGMLSRSWARLLDSIRSGKTAAELAGVQNSFEVLARDPELARTFNEAMVAFTRQVVPAVLAAYDFSDIRRLIDVGGGYGELLSAILAAYPTMHGAVFDLPGCGDGAKKQFADTGVGERGEFIGGNFFESVPTGADALIMKSIIHDWNDERSLTILRNCRRALPEAGCLLLVERLMPESLEATAEHAAVALSDLNMLRGPGGCERTQAEYGALLGQSGFRVTRVLPAGRMHVIEARVG
jgi:hypothetical protein